MNALALAGRTLDGVAPAVRLAVAAAAGFDAIGLVIDPADWTAPSLRDAHRRIADSGVALLDIEVVRIHPGPLPDEALRTIAIGGELGARHLLVIGHDPDRAHTIDAFGEICDRAADAGMLACLEFMGFRAVATLADAVAVVTGAAHPAGRVLVDTQHLARTGGLPADLRRVPPTLLAYAQICDAPAAMPGDGAAAALMADAMQARLLPGEGGLDVAGFIAALPPDLPLSVELLGRAVRDRYANLADYARAIRAAAARCLPAG